MGNAGRVSDAAACCRLHPSALHCAVRIVVQCWSDSASVSAWMASRNFSLADAYYYYEQRMVNISRAMNRRSMLWVDAAGYPPNFAANSTYAAFPGELQQVQLPAGVGLLRACTHNCRAFDRLQTSPSTSGVGATAATGKPTLAS